MHFSRFGNLGHLDQILRIAIGCALVQLDLIDTELIQDPLSCYRVGGFGVVNMGAAQARYCPRYALAGINTCRLD